MDELLNRLRSILIAESRAQNALKEIKSDKEAVLEELNGMIKADNYANDFVTLRKKPKIRVLDEQIAADFMKDVKQIDKQKVEDYFYSGQKVPGVDIEIKLIAYKKKNGLL
jgi:hypothetical protein